MRYILGVFGVIVLMIFVVVLIARRGPDNSTSATKTNNLQAVLSDYESKPATVIFTTRGKVIGDEERRGIRITVSRQERVIEILKGYNETVETRQTYTNNDNAFANFLSALGVAGFANEQPTAIKDDRGICPLGRRFDYKLQDGSKEVFRFWNTSCGLRQGSFAGDGLLVRKLFENQIPDYRTVIRGVKL